MPPNTRPGDASPASPRPLALRFLTVCSIGAAVLLVVSIALAVSAADAPLRPALLFEMGALVLLVLGFAALRRVFSLAAPAPTSALFTAQAPTSESMASTPTESSPGQPKDDLIGPLAEQTGHRHVLAEADSGHAILLRDMINQIPYPLFAQDSDGNVLFVNAALAALYGTTPAKLVQSESGSHLRKLCSEDLLTRPAGNPNGEEWLTTIDGQERRYLVQRLPFHSTIQGELVVAIDVTELHRLQLQLQFSQRLEVLGTLAGGIAHDFNNLLTPILGYSSMLLEEPLSPAQRQKMEAIATSADRARAVAQQMLSFSRQSDDLTIRESIDLPAVIEEAIAFMRASVPPNISIRSELEQTPPINADAGQLHQVLVNLCTNAAQAITAPSGEVLVTCCALPPGSTLLPDSLKGQDYAMLQVIDNGAGMTEAVMSHVFEPFFTTKDVGEGSGLGLSTAKGIISRHQGDITVSSAKNEGTCFSVFLPLAAARSNTNSGPSSQARLLLVDDDAMVLQVLEDLLSTQGYAVTACAEPREALQLLEDSERRFDIMITDNNMPRMKGVELARLARKQRSDLPIVLITGFAKPNASELTHISRHLHKPVSTKDLTSVIRELTAPNQAA